MSRGNLPAEASSGTADVVASPNRASCAWTLRSSASWLTVSEQGVDTSHGQFTYAASANVTGQTREAQLHVEPAGGGNGVAVTVRQDAGAQLTIVPTSQNVGPGAQSGSANVTASNVFSWTATVTQGSEWLSIVAGSTGGSGTSSLTYSVATNASSNPREGRISVSSGALAPAILTVIQAGAGPNVALSPTDQVVTAAAQSGLQVTVAANVNWTAAVAQGSEWLSISGGNSGNGNGTITYMVQANPTPSPREGRIVVTGAGGVAATLTVTQAPPASCEIAVTPAQLATVSATGASGQVTVTSTCPWSASSSQQWLTWSQTSGSAGTVQVGYSIAVNPGAARGPAVVTVSGGGASATFTVPQQAGAAPASCEITVTPPQLATAPAAGTSGQVTVMSTCAWNATSSQPWLTWSQTSGSAGTLQVGYSVGANSGPARGPAVMTASGGGATATFTVASQAGVASTISFQDPNPPEVAAGGQTGLTAQVLSTVANWTASVSGAAASWLSITSGSPGSGNGPITYAVGANPGTARTGEITASGPGGTPTATLTVRQAPGILEADFSVQNTGGDPQGSPCRVDDAVGGTFVIRCRFVPVFTGPTLAGQSHRFYLSASPPTISGGNLSGGQTMVGPGGATSLPLGTSLDEPSVTCGLPNDASQEFQMYVTVQVYTAVVGQEYVYRTTPYLFRKNTRC